MRWTRYAGWLNVVVGIGLAVVFAGLGMAIVGVVTGAALVASGAFMVWLAAGWDKPLEDTSELHRYGRPANAKVLAVDEQALDAAGGRTARVKLHVAPVNESDFITTRTLALPGGRVPAVGEAVTVKFDPQNRKNVVLLEEAFVVEDHLTAANRMFGGGTALGAFVVALVLALAAPAGAAVTQMSSGVPVTQVDLAGQSVVFGSFGDGKSQVLRADPGGARTLLGEFTGIGGDDDECCQTYYSTGFVASPTQVAVSDFYEAYAKGSLAQSDYRLRAGPVQGGAPPLLFMCGGNHPYDLDGDRIAYLGDDCTEKTSGQGARIVVRNLAASGAPVVGSFPMTEQPNTIDLAGEYVAVSGFFQRPPELRVYDAGSGAVVYKLNHNFAQYSMQSDGKLAVAHPAELGECRIEWFSPAEPVAHRLDTCPRGRVRMAGDRIAVDRLDGGTSSLDVVSLNGDRRSVTFFDPPGALSGFDWDGSRLAYGVQGCVRSDDTLWVEDLVGSDPPVVEGGACTATIDTKTARADRKGLVRLRVTCPDGCAGLLTLYSGRSVASRRSASFTIRGGGSRTVPIRLGTLRDVRRLGSRAYQARVEVDQRGTNIRTFKRNVRVLRPKS